MSQLPVDGFVSKHDAVLPPFPYKTTTGTPTGILTDKGRPAPQHAPSNPKTLMGRLKLPVLSVIPSSALLREAEAMKYGAFEAPRADGGFGYGPFNWRDTPIEYMVYVDAAVRHITQAVEGEDVDPQSKALHLAHARATLGILIDAIENGSCIDDRPKQKSGTATRILDEVKARKG